MNLRTFFLLLLLILIGVFSALNWSTITTPTTLSLGFTTVLAPLGLLMLGLLITITIIFLAFIVYLQTSVLLENRRHARVIQAHRELADQAEASRFTDLRKFMEDEIRRIAEREEQSTTALLTRIDNLETAMRASLDDSNNTLAAYIGELEDRMERDERISRNALIDRNKS